MADWTDGCYNGVRFAEGVAGGAGTRTWLAAADTTVADQPNNKTIIVAIAMDTDDMCSLSDDMVIQWQDDTDVSGYSDLSGSGELTWSGVSDLSNGNAVVDAESMGEENCSSMGVSHEDGVEREGANLIATSGAGSKKVIDFHWCVDLSGATAAHDYSFRFRTQTGGGGDLIATTTAVVEVVAAGKIDGITKNSDRSAALGSVTVSAYRSDDAGTDPAPTGPLISSVVSNVTTGVYSLTGLVSGFDYFLHFYKDDTADLSDGSPPVTAVAA
jgi:hypothetical protein